MPVPRGGPGERVAGRTGVGVGLGAPLGPPASPGAGQRAPRLGAGLGRVPGERRGPGGEVAASGGAPPGRRAGLRSLLAVWLPPAPPALQGPLQHPARRPLGPVPGGAVPGAEEPACQVVGTPPGPPQPRGETRGADGCGRGGSRLTPHLCSAPGTRGPCGFGAWLAEAWGGEGGWRGPTTGVSGDVGTPGSEARAPQASCIVGNEARGSRTGDHGHG